MKFITTYNPKLNVDFVSAGPLATKIGFASVALPLVCASIFGINWGIDFVGGTEVQAKFGEQKPTAQAVRDVLQEQGFSNNQVQAYGESGTEWLIRVERISTITADDEAKLKGAIGEAFAAELGGKPLSLERSSEQGDRFSVVLPAPSAVQPAPATPAPPADAPNGTAPAPTPPSTTAEQNLAQQLDAQQAKLAQAVEEKAGMRLRRTRATENGAESTEDAILRDDPYQGTIRYTVQLQGVSDKLQRALSMKFGKTEILRADFVDAKVAESLKTDGVLALLIAIVLILVYVALRFDVYFAPGAVIALIHDPLLALGLFVFGRQQLELPVVAAMLTIIGYSINNTIVIYDRIREMLPSESQARLSFERVEQIVNRAINETMSRTINTTLTTLFTASAVFVFTTGAVRIFAATLCLGFIVGALSSMLIAPSIYLFFRKNFHNPDEKPKRPAGFSRAERERGIV